MELKCSAGRFTNRWEEVPEAFFNPALSGGDGPVSRLRQIGTMGGFQGMLTKLLSTPLIWIMDSGNRNFGIPGVQLNSAELPGIGLLFVAWKIVSAGVKHSKICRNWSHIVVQPHLHPLPLFKNNVVCMLLFYGCFWWVCFLHNILFLSTAEDRYFLWTWWYSWHRTHFLALSALQ